MKLILHHFDLLHLALSWLNTLVKVPEMFEKAGAVPIVNASGNLSDLGLGAE